MFWAAFGYGIKTELVIMAGDPESARGGVTARVYHEVLDQHLKPILGLGTIFMHDNAPIHTAHIIRDWLIENEVDVMNWPPYSPDLNPIENLWALLKEQIYKRHPELLIAINTEETLEELIIAAVEVWNDLGDQLLARLCDTMPHRVEAVLKAAGWYTKY